MTPTIHQKSKLILCIITSLSCFGICAFSGAAGANPCDYLPLPSGPCVECPLEFDEPKDLATSPPLYWDICRREDSSSGRVIYFLPTGISAIVKSGQYLQTLRIRENSILLTVSLNYHPWGNESDLNQSALIHKLVKKYANLRVKGIVPTSYQIHFKGKWREWVKDNSITMTPLSGMDFFQKLRLEIVFDKAYQKQATEALRRDMGILGEVLFVFTGLTQDGIERDVLYSFPLHVGHLQLQ